MRLLAALGTLIVLLIIGALTSFRPQCFVGYFRRL
jgi:hypothetical protein